MDIQQQIKRYQQNDELTVDLYRRLKTEDPYKTKGRSAYSGLAEQDYPRHEQLGVPIIYQSWHYSFPQELIDQFKHMQSNFSTGLLPSIMRAWMSIDSDLYLWNFENNRDLAYYDAINNTILHVDIVVPKAGYSYPSLHSILIVATTVDILLLALSFQDSSGQILLPGATDLKNATIMMVGGSPLYRLQLDGLIITDLCPTGNGRIFFSADDSLFELEYFEKGWFGTGGNCKRTNHSKRLINYLVPVLQIFYAKDSIFQLAIDDSRHLLWILMKSGSIQLFDLGQDGHSIQKFGAIYREQIEHLARESCSVNAEYFSEIVQISPVTIWQSVNVNLIATTAKGVRIYISCLIAPIKESESSQEMQRPSAIRILHFRFPPETAYPLHSLNVYSTHHTHDCMLMATPGNDPETSILLTHSNAFSSFDNQFVENISNHRLRGNVWEIVHIRPRMQKYGGGSKTLMVFNWDKFPLCIEQHLSPLEKFYIITSKGIYVFDHLSPLEIFRHILTQYGNDSKQFQALSSVINPTELCTMALCVLCSESSSDVTIRDMALRVFFAHGGEPKLAYGGGEQFLEYGARPRTSEGILNGSLMNNTSIFSPKTPLRTSTPQNGGQTYTNGFTPQHPITPGGLDVDQSILAGAKVLNSPRHEALFTYFARIVQEIWKRKLCATRQSNNVYSLLKQQEVEQIGNFLNAFRRALDEHSLITSPTLHHHSHSFQYLQSQQQRHSSPMGETSLLDQERQTLQKLRTLVAQTGEVLALWGVLLEHELHSIFVMLAPDVQRCLLSWNLDDLTRSRNDVCADLISALIRFYIGDDASTTAISNRLRKLCPTLFTMDDVSVVRATENIYKVKASMQPRPEMLQEAVVQFRKSIQKVNLIQTCDLLLQVLHFEGIVDLALSRARCDDLNELALVAYKKHICSSDVAINEGIKKRLDAYSCISELLRLLQTLAISHGTQLTTLSLANIFPSADSIKGQLSPSQAQVERDKVIAKVLESDDELACVHVFRWMLANNLGDQLISSNFKYFEAFLFHEIEDGKGNAYMELLWKYYEKNQNYLEAAKVLTELASKTTHRVNIGQRIEYLSHALMCIQSAAETKGNTELKQNIQDKLDVAQIQQRTKVLLETDTGPEAAARGREAMEILSYRLCNLTQLYDYGKIFGIFEVKLAVLHCAGKYEEEIVQSIWRDLLQKELQNFQLNRTILESIQKNLSSILFRLKRRYCSSPKFVPIEFILRELIIFCFKHLAPNHWLLELCHGAEISYRKLLMVASEQYRIDDPFWRQNQRAYLFMLELAASIMERCGKEAVALNSTERKVLKETCLGFHAELAGDAHKRVGFGGGASMQRNIVERLELMHTNIGRNF